MWALRVSHSAVVDAWRERERALRRLRPPRRRRVGCRVVRGGRRVALVPRARARPSSPHAPSARHPALFLYDPRPLWRALGRPVDVIDIHEEPFALATAEVLLLRWLRRQRAPYVLYSAQNLDKRYPVPFRWFERAALRHARGVNVCNAAAGRIVERKGFPGRARTIDLGTDLDRLHATPPDAVTPARTVPVVGFAGRLDAAQGRRRAAARPWRLEPAVRVRLAGDGPERHARWSSSRARLGVADRVEFLGALAPEALPDFYRVLDVLAVPSLTTPSWVEQFGRVAVEAMACGTPVVVSDSGALPEVVGEAAIVVAEGDAAELAKALASRGARPRRRAEAACRGARPGRDDVAGTESRSSTTRLYRAATTQWSTDVSRRAWARGRRRRLRPARAARRGARAARRRCRSPSSTTRRHPTCAPCAEAAGVRYVDPGRNGGFGAGVNEALRTSSTRAPTCCSSTRTPSSARETSRCCARALLAEPDLASVGPAQVDADGHAGARRVALPVARRRPGSRRPDSAA